MKEKFSKVLLTVLALVMLISIDLAAKENVKEVRIQTNAFSYMCKDRIEQTLKELKGVESVFLSLDDKVVTIEYNEETVKTDAMLNSVKDIGYEAELLSKPMNAENKTGEKDPDKKLN